MMKKMNSRAPRKGHRLFLGLAAFLGLQYFGLVEYGSFLADAHELKVKSRINGDGGGPLKKQLRGDQKVDDAKLKDLHLDNTFLKDEPASLEFNIKAMIKGLLLNQLRIEGKDDAEFEDLRLDHSDTDVGFIREKGSASHLTSLEEEDENAGVKMMTGTIAKKVNSYPNLENDTTDVQEDNSNMVATFQNAPPTSNTINDNTYDSYGNAISEGVNVINAFRDVAEDASTANYFAAVGAVGGLVSGLVPPPAGLAIGGSMMILGALFGPSEPSNQDVIGEINKGFARIDARLDSISAGVARIEASVEKLNYMIGYNTILAEETVLRGRTVQIHEIHSAYLYLISHMPQSEEDLASGVRSWTRFFDEAHAFSAGGITGGYAMGDYGNLSPASVRALLVFYGQATLNDIGMCGQAVLFQWVAQVRFELFFIISMAKTSKIDGCDDNSRFCWRPDATIANDAELYHQDLKDYDTQILTATSMGGLGIAHLVQALPSTLLQGVDVSTQTGRCYSCQQDDYVNDEVEYNCRAYKEVPEIPPSNTFPVEFEQEWFDSGYQSCKIGSKQFDARYWNWENNCGHQCTNCDVNGCRHSANNYYRTGDGCCKWMDCYWHGCGGGGCPSTHTEVATQDCWNFWYVNEYCCRQIENIRRWQSSVKTRDGTHNTRCCSCSCLNEGDYSNSWNSGGVFAGSYEDHVDVHCPAHELKISYPPVTPDQRFPLPNPILPSARFVKVSLKGEDRILSLAEVQVYDETGQDVALLSEGATATQSSTMYPASKAIDGVTNGDITHTVNEGEKDPWWMVDLGLNNYNAPSIQRVVLYNRRDCCTDRLSGARVSLLDYKKNSIAERSIGDSDGISTFELDFASGPRFVKVSVQGDNKVLSLAEVEVFALVGGEEKDIALQSEGAEATQSSDYYGRYPASLAIDGDTIGGLTHTNFEKDPWWMVDLGENADQHTIKKIVLYNREDCCTERLSEARVSILDSNNNLIREMSIGDSTGVKQFELNPNYPKFVKVSLQGTNRVLSLAEVQVFAAGGSGEVNIAPDGSATQSSNYNNGFPALNAIDGVTTGDQSDITHTNEEKDPWWMVTLDAYRPVTRVVLWNRRDCCTERLSGARVSLLDSDHHVIAEQSIIDSTGKVSFELHFNLE